MPSVLFEEGSGRTKDMAVDFFRRASLRPVHQLACHHDLGGDCFEATGNDPRFLVDLPARLKSRTPGWVRVALRVEVLDGFVLSPCLYPDYGSGMSESTRIDLPEPDTDGWIDAVVSFTGALCELRFDPTIHPARFRITDFRIARLSRIGALLRMAHALSASRAGHPAARWAMLKRLAAATVRGQLRALARAVATSYSARHRQLDRNYQHWLALFAPSLRPMPVTGAPANACPLVSILLPVCDPSPDVLRACLDSVRAQTDPRWQLCIADDASTDPEVRAILSSYTLADSRIRVTFAKERTHISANTNRALALADAPFVGFLDHDDILAVDAIEAVASTLARFPGARLLYSDEDKIDTDGVRHSPHFKPAWNPDLLRSLNYIAHFMVVDAALVRELGGLRMGFEGSQDHDLALRCTERLAPEEIVHIPRILYHWRTVEGSTSLGAQQKPYVIEAGRLAVAEHLARNGLEGEVHVQPDGRYRVRWALPDLLPRVTIIVPTRDRVELLRTCVESVLRHTRYRNFEVVVVDNDSRDPETLAYLESACRHPKVSVMPYSREFNFSAIVNHAVRASRGDVICLLNNDIEAIHEGWLIELVSQALRPDVGAVGAMLYYPDDTIQHAGVILGIGGIAGHSHCRLRRGTDGYISRARVVQNLTAVTAACMAFRRDVFERVDGFDEHLAVAFNDVDFCLRLAGAGFRNVWTPFAELYHHESASRGPEDTPEKRARFQREVAFMRERWGSILELDPSYNPNLSLESHHFELAYPPRTLDGRTAVFRPAVAA